MIYPLSATSQSIDVMIVDDSGLPVTGLAAATFPTLTYSLAGPNADVAFPALSDLAAITTAYASGGVKERGNGVYRLDLPNAVFTTAGEVRIRGEATGKHVLAPWIDVAVTVATLTNLPAVPTDWLTAAGVKADAVTKIQAGLSTYAGADTPGTATLLLRVTAPVALAGSAPSWYAVPVDVSANVLAIKTKTDLLTFTAAGSVDANVRKVNDVNVGGTGALGNEWGPA